MKSKFLGIAIALLALILCGTALLSYAQEPAGPPSGGHGFGGAGHRNMGFMLRELNLTDAQKEQIKGMVKAQRASMRTTGQALASWDLAKEYGFTDTDGRTPDWGTYFERQVKKVS